MKKYFLLLALFAAINTYAQSTNFSGKYLLNKTKTDFGNAPEYVLARAFNISQTATAITIDRTMLNQTLEEKQHQQKLNFDGTAFQGSTLSGNKETGTAKWDKQTLVLHFDIKNPDGLAVMQITEHWTLTDSGKTLVDERTTEQADGNTYTIKAYYDKQ